MARNLRLLILVSAVLLLVTPVMGAGPVVVKKVPYTITTPGAYCLNGNLTCPDGHGITVNADNVTIDLRGFTLSGNSSSYGININSRNNVEVSNGTLFNWKYAVFEISGFYHRIINVRTQFNEIGIYLQGLGHLVKNCTISYGNQGLIVHNGAVTNNIINDNVTGLKLLTGSIIGNTFINNTNGVQLLTGEGVGPVLMDHNTISGSNANITNVGNTTFGTNAGF